MIKLGALELPTPLKPLRSFLIAPLQDLNHVLPFTASIGTCTPTYARIICIPYFQERWVQYALHAACPPRAAGGKGYGDSLIGRSINPLKLLAVTMVEAQDMVFPVCWGKRVATQGLTTC